MKPFLISWKDKIKVFAFKLSWQDKEKLSKAADATIDLLRKTHDLTPLECAVVLDNLSEGLSDTCGELWETEIQPEKRS